MNLHIRRQDILKTIQMHSTVAVDELIRHYNESAAPIRKDLTHLEKAGLIARTRGEAHIARSSSVMPVSARSSVNAEGKKRIARIAARMVAENESIVLDSGTTTLAIAQELPSNPHLHVITNSVYIAVVLANRNISVNVCGGVLDTNNMSLVGPEAERYFSRLEVDTMFLSASGVRGTTGLCVVSPLECHIKKQMMQIAKKVYAVIDSSKLGSNGINLITDFASLDALITDQPVHDPLLRDALERYEVAVIHD
ncbi:MAG: DeoR/GlpR family DNA-binding transcription regulator [Planctomycetaceae bacterium]|nr:DeoR/GlpR family DNA-binding transcription regulator [Planctomycetaceae bacterium]